MSNVIMQMPVSGDGSIAGHGGDDASRPGNGVERLHPPMRDGGPGTGRTGADQDIPGGPGQRPSGKGVTMHHDAIRAGGEAS